ncbi:hypothetical protein SAMN04488029_2445 [Reichenbachiella faecimaris]|uniref:Lipoprotein n=1 Tax=Reichenbachiella faecimaris TaxID=692418 RepID=A0A1W2GF55_REIFA|nr:hypothetical protein [Reichenbachiella faecimaris]SMD35309.1 hypothetical protein SAMN04488029_2445 [Reichenbachiella faecimaris]
MANFKFFLFLLVIGCSSKPEVSSLYSITSKARCKGPTRSYHTELHATADGYTRFHQSYPSDYPDYDAIIYGDTLGFVLTSDTIERWTESREISVGKGHSFHMISHNPKLVFNYVDGKYFDTIGNEVDFIFHENSDRVQSFQITNPFDETERIEIFFSKWEEVQEFEFPMQVQIIQGGKNEYFFEFYEVKINDPTFSKIPPS